MIHQEQVPRKQGLKRKENSLARAVEGHQEQVPRKQGLKHLIVFPPNFESRIKSKFHENKD